LSLSNTIGIIFDFDDTLGEDTTNLFLKTKLGMKTSEIRRFWNKEVDALIKEGWDPPLAYIDLIMQRLETKNLRLRNRDLRELGRHARLFRGVPDLFQRLRAFVQKKSEFVEAHVGIEFYVISGGFEEIIRGTPIGKEMKDIFGCTFEEKEGTLRPKSIVTFTEKTKFLYAINKGISGLELRRNPYSVNDVIHKNQRRISFSNMIYVGDGPTDIPCFSAVLQNGGKTIGVLKYSRKVTKEGELIVDKTKAWAIAKGERATVGPYLPEYRNGDNLFINLKIQIERAGLEIYTAFKRRG
jgi:phosphoserine phosphatase